MHTYTVEQLDGEVIATILAPVPVTARSIAITQAWDESAKHGLPTIVRNEHDGFLWIVTERHAVTVGHLN